MTSVTLDTRVILKKKTQLFPCERDYLCETSGILTIYFYLMMKKAREKYYPDYGPLGMIR